jgi:ribosomal protein S18 acetylase RimI-like enzyme
MARALFTTDDTQIGSHSGTSQAGLRPVHLATDLRPLADLIELAFASALDAGGRSAIQEMRALSNLGPAIALVRPVNELIRGLSTGFVWMDGDRLVGNVSYYQAGLPGGLGNRWVIANVAVHPEYRRRGLAERLMASSLAAIRQQGGESAYLQVDYDNPGAIRLYEKLGFAHLDAFAEWYRPTRANRAPAYAAPAGVIHVLTPAGWPEELALIRAERGPEIGWLRPADARLVRRQWWQAGPVGALLGGPIHTAIRDEDGALAALLWREGSNWLAPTRLTLFTLAHATSHAEHALLAHAAGAVGGALRIEHPYQDIATGTALASLGFRRRRVVWHMWIELGQGRRRHA